MQHSQTEPRAPKFSPTNRASAPTRTDSGSMRPSACNRAPSTTSPSAPPPTATSRSPRTWPGKCPVSSVRAISRPQQVVLSRLSEGALRSDPIRSDSSRPFRFASLRSSFLVPSATFQHLPNGFFLLLKINDRQRERQRQSEREISLFLSLSV